MGKRNTQVSAWGVVIGPQGICLSGVLKASLEWAGAEERHNISCRVNRRYKNTNIEGWVELGAEQATCSDQEIVNDSDLKLR